MTPAVLRGYLELLRPANVATALADVLAGYAVAGRANLPALPWLLAATACLYGGGIVLNDVFDRRVDAVERPERPIPSGRVKTATAAWIGAGLLAGGVLASSRATAEATLIAAGIAGCVLLYDGWSKRYAVVGPVNMGLCRGLNLLLGMAAVPGALAKSWPLGSIALVYIAAVTALSRGEVSGGRRRTALAVLILLAGVLATLAALALQPAPPSLAGLALTLLLAWRILPAFWRAYRVGGAGPIRQAIHAGVLSLVLVDAVIGATYAGMIYSLAILATAGLAGALARRFPVT